MGFCPSPEKLEKQMPPAKSIVEKIEQTEHKLKSLEQNPKSKEAFLGEPESRKELRSNIKSLYDGGDIGNAVRFAERYKSLTQEIIEGVYC